MSEIIDQSTASVVKELCSLGLSEKEALVYLALLPRRDTGSSKLVIATGLHKQFVYNALGKLESLGLAKHVIQNGRKKFSANTPQRIVSLIEEKRVTAERLATELQKKFISAHDQDAEIFQGDNAFAMHQMNNIERMPEGTILCVIASASERYGAILREHELWDEFERIRKSKNITIRYLGSESQLETLKNRMGSEKPWEYRILPGHATGLMNTDIWDDHVTFNIFGEPVLSITITGKEITDGYRQFFDTLWKLGTI
jgi:sugar-specific transcriptional regulator TrmB